MCPLKQLCAPRHGGRGGKNNGLGTQVPSTNMQTCRKTNFAEALKTRVEKTASFASICIYIALLCVAGAAKGNC